MSDQSDLNQRRNGKAASCEPCRKSKLRCDHVRPTCGRCLKRGNIEQCYYHPAPLTRPRDGVVTASPNRPSFGVHKPWRAANPTVRRATGGLIHDSNITTPSSSGDLASPGTRNDVTRNLDVGYLGPMNFASDLNLYLKPDKVYDPIHSPEDPSYASNDLDADHVRVVTDILKLFVDFPWMEKVVPKYYEFSATAAISAPLILTLLPPMRAFYERVFGRSKTLSLAHAAQMILEKTRQPLKLNAATTAGQFNDLMSDPVPRLEALGIIYIITAKSHYFGLAPYSQDNEDGQAVRDNLYTASDRAIDIIYALQQSNDAFLWLLFENTLLASSLVGDGSLMVWRRLGSFATEIFCLGVHREAHASENIPFWLAEVRRKIFAAGFQLDKGISSLLGRPPRLSRRHTDLQMPLDLSDEDTVLEGEALEYAKRQLDAEGWHLGPGYRKASWIRQRCILAHFREDISDFSLSNPEDQTFEKLQNILSRCQQAWEALPPRLHFREECWSEGISFNDCVMLVVTRLQYLQCHFLINRFIVKVLKNTESVSTLIDIASSVVSAILSLGRRRSRFASVRRDFSWLILDYGLPSAVILAESLKTSGNKQTLLPNHVPRSKVVRDLSVFISSLEDLSKPGNTDHAAGLRAYKVLSALLDEALDESATPNVSNENSAAQIDQYMILDDDLSGVFGHEGFSSMMHPIGFPNDIDWASISGQVTF